MKRLLAISALIVSLCVGLQAQINPKEWNTEGVKNNPVANTVLCQYQNENPTGETHTVHFVVSSSVTGAFVLEHMDAANTGVLKSHLFPISASLPFESMRFLITLDASERIRLRTNALLVGNVQCSMFVE